ncbi:hypothetical protein AM500_18000 [Bacillus sp. FJAT-18017]|uniref:hypothetical protein n=1 Tax=Bacillus sp. FJAT-18017 TaxID=1705566 RepID=UPI0006ADB41D|nr:hypothetical protein [Bacillus sp. FJAT-18017]ALC91470.1 hypothetical protein AM500_18000 [Bacillus sp. FJAT-18017]
MLRSTPYCNLIAQGRSQEGNDIAAVERIFIKGMKRDEIRFAWYKQVNGSERFQPRPLDLTEEELLKVLEDGVANGVFSTSFRENLKKIL